MHANEIVPHKVKRQGVAMVLELFLERIGQPGEAAHAHCHRKFLPLRIGRVDMIRSGLPMTVRVRVPMHAGGL